MSPVVLPLAKQRGFVLTQRGVGEIVRDEEVRSGQPEFLSLFLGPPKLFLSRARLGFMGQVFMGPLPNSELELIPSKVHMCMVSPGMFNWSPAQPSYSTAKLICNLTVLL